VRLAGAVAALDAHLRFGLHELPAQGFVLETGHAEVVGDVLDQALDAWFHDEQMQGNIRQRMAEGIERSAVVLICVSRKYMERVKMDGSNNCKLEFEYADRKRTPLCMLPIVMEGSMIDTATWDEVLGLVLGSYSSCPLTSDVDANFDCAVAKIAESVDKMLHKALPNEMQSAARAICSRSASPSASERSSASTEPRSALAARAGRSGRSVRGERSA
jgi:hypothetical protein